MWCLFNVPIFMAMGLAFLRASLIRFLPHHHKGHTSANPMKTG